MWFNINKLTSDFHQIRIYTDLKIKILSKFQIIQILINFEIFINYMSQMFLVKNRWKNIRSSRRIWYINDEMIYCYEIINIDYTVKNFERTFRSEVMFFHAVNMTEHDFILEISWLTAHNFIMNWNVKSWHYCLIDDWIIIKKSEIFIQFIQNKKTVFW